MERLSPRQQSILNRVIETHIETAQPVGSRFITDLYTELYRNSYSPATVRAEMGLLEERGYLTQPHTSAGRIPTDLGYRYYVDNSLKQEDPSQETLNQLRELQEAEEESLGESVSKILSQQTEEVGLLVMHDSRSSRRCRLFFQGSSRVLEKPEFQDVSKAQGIFRALEEKESLAQWLLEQSSETRVTIRIGRENSWEALQYCSVVSCGYGSKRPLGTVAILGPRRMKYNRTIPLVMQMARFMKDAFGNDRD